MASASASEPIRRPADDAAAMRRFRALGLLVAALAIATLARLPWAPSDEGASRIEKAPPSEAAVRALVAGTTLDVNTATAADLELLPGIGPALAQRIVDDRARSGPFRTLEDLDRVRGIGPRTVERLRPFVRTGHGASSSPDGRLPAP